MEVEVFRLNTFDKELNYAFALKTRTEGSYPNQKYYTKNTLQFVGKHISSARWGYGNNASGAETFDDNGKITEIIYDYEGNTCFTVV